MVKSDMLEVTKYYNESISFKYSDQKQFDIFFDVKFKMDTNNSINVDLFNVEINDTKSNKIDTFNGTVYCGQLKKTHCNNNSSFSVYSLIDSINDKSGRAALQISDINVYINILEDTESVTNTPIIHTNLQHIAQSSSQEYSETLKPLSNSTTLNSISITNTTINPSRTASFPKIGTTENSTQISTSSMFTSGENGESTAQILNMSTVQTGKTTGSSTQVSQKSTVQQSATTQTSTNVSGSYAKHRSETTESSKESSRGTTVKTIESTQASTQTSRRTMIQPTQSKETSTQTSSSTMIQPTQGKETSTQTSRSTTIQPTKSEETSTQTSTTPNVQPTASQTSSKTPSTTRRTSPQTSVRTESTNKQSTIPLTTTSVNRELSTQKPRNSTPLPNETKEFSKGGNTAKIVLCVVIVCFFIGFVVTLAYKNGLIQSKLQKLADRINREVDRM